MAEYHEVATIDELPVGSGKEVVVAGKLIALFNVDGELFALDGMCAHAGGPLGKGCLEGGVVTCPWHGWQYDVTSGQHCLTENIKQESFLVKVEEGKILIELTAQ